MKTKGSISIFPKIQVEVYGCYYFFYTLLHIGMQEKNNQLLAQAPITQQNFFNAYGSQYF